MNVEPLLGLRVRTPRLELRLPRDEELVELARVAERGVHPPDLMPFSVAWTDAIGRPDFVERFAGYHHACRAEVSVESWRFDFGVWADGELVGAQGMFAERFARTRTFETGSWLGLRFQGRGIGTEMRYAALHFGFAGLGAQTALSGALDGNPASARVSAKVGYEPAGEDRATPRGEPVRVQKFRLTRERWERLDRPPVELEGVAAALPLFIG